jgi:hypothetical protein
MGQLDQLWGPLIDKIDKEGIDPGTWGERFDMHSQYRVSKPPAANAAEPIRIQGRTSLRCSGLHMKTADSGFVQASTTMLASAVYGNGGITPAQRRSLNEQRGKGNLMLARFLSISQPGRISGVW